MLKMNAKLPALVAAALLACAGAGPGQSSKAKPASGPAKTDLASIEDMLATALKYNPDIRVAEVKLRDDEAELNRTRLRVMQKIIALHHALQSHRANVAGALAKYRRLEELVRRGTVQPALLKEAEQELSQARARLSEAEAELPYLLGQQKDSLGREIIRTEVQIGSKRFGATAIRPATARKIHQALDSPVEVDFRAVPFADVLKGLEDKAKGVAFQENLALKDLGQIKVSLRLGKVPLGGALLALQDTIPGLRIVIRDYGILITWEHQVPIGAVRLYDFWKETGDKDGRQ
jgi:hypothetical protein